MTSTFHPKANLEKLELVLLCLFFLFLPLREAPKNIFLFSYFFIWAINRWRSRNWGTSNWGFDAPLLLAGLLGVVGSILKAPNALESVIDNIDFLTIGFLAILMRRSPWGFELLFKLLLGFSTIGVTTALLEGSLKGVPHPYLRSVGHINQVAIFLSVYFFILFSTCLSAERRENFWILAGLSISTVLLIFATESRNAAFAVVTVTFAVLYLGAKLRMPARRALTIGIALLCTVTVATVTYAPALYQKQLAHLSRGGLDVERSKLWRASLLAFKEEPLLGYGAGNYRSATSEVRIREILDRQQKIYDPADYLHLNHAHNLFFHWLVERGLIGTLIIIFWFGFLGVSTFRFWRCVRKSPSQPGTKLEGANHALMLLFSVTLGVALLGIWNTSLKYEHGLLSAAVIGLAYARLQADNREPR